MAVHVMHKSGMDLEWFQARKKELKLPDREIGAAIGRDRSIANRLFSGGVGFDVNYADGLADVLQVSRAEILHRAGITDAPPNVLPATARDLVSDPDTVEIQHLDLAFGLGGTFTDSGAPEVDLLPFPRPWVETITRSPAELLTWTRGRGESMRPTIDDGDLVLLDRSQRDVREQDAMWAFTIGDVASIKRLRVKGDRFQILSDNPSVPMDEEPIDFVNIVARVVFVGRRV